MSAMPRLANRRDALVAQAQLLTTVGARRNAQEGAAVQGRHFDFRAKRRFGYGNGHDGIQVIAPAFEKRMRLDFGNDVQIARGRAGGSGISAARNAHTRTGLHTSGNSNLDGVNTAHAAVAGAQPAEITNAPSAPAARARQIKSHPATGLCHLSSAAAGRAGLRLAHGSSA